MPHSTPAETSYAAGTYVIPMTQVFARYAKDLLEKQTYPEARRETQNSKLELPYDVTAWSLGMLLGVDVDFVTTPLPTLRMTRVLGEPARWPGIRERPALTSSSTPGQTRRSRSIGC